MNDDREHTQEDNFKRKILLSINKYLTSLERKNLIKAAIIILIAVKIILYFSTKNMEQRFMKLQAEYQFSKKILFQNQALITQLKAKNSQLQATIFAYESKLMKQTQQINHKMEIYTNTTDKSLNQQKVQTNKLGFELQKAKQMALKLSEVFTKLNETFSNNQEKINRLFTNQFSREIKEYNFMVQNSKLLAWKIFLENQDYFKMHYKKTSENPITIVKSSTEIQFIQNTTSFPKDQRSFVKIRIQKNQNSDISIGFKITEPQTVYYYLYTRNKYIYKGLFYSTASSVKTSNSEVIIKEKDIITMFYDYQLSQVIWYVNKRYVSHIGLPQNFTGYIFSFVAVPTKGDIISIL